MLTIELLKQNSKLASLPDDQLAAIAEMSRNDENETIGTRIGALHGQYDADVFGITGVKKNEGEKSYDYVKRVLGSYKETAGSAEAVKQQLSDAKAQVAQLQSQIESQKGNETLAQQLKDAKAQVAQLQSQLSAKESDLEARKSEYESSIKGVHVDYAFKAATEGLKFKSGITEAVQKALIATAKAEVLAKGTPDLIDDAGGNKVLVLRGANGNIINNPNNGLNPYTVQELIMETAIKDVLETGRHKTGGGTGGSKVGGGGSATLDLSGVKSQVEADRMIESHLLSIGVTRDSQEFAEKSLQMRSDNNVANLPIR